MRAGMRRPARALARASLVLANRSVVGIGFVAVSATALHPVPRRRLIGEGIARIAAAVCREIGVTEAIAADSCRGVLALLHCRKAAADHEAGHVATAEFAGTCAAGGGSAKNDCGDERRSRHAEFVECSHFLRLVCFG